MGVRRGLVIVAVTTGFLWTASANAATTRPVAVRDNVFSPAAVTAVQGDSIKWTNSGAPHTTTSTIASPVGWDKTLNPGATFTKKIAAAGTYAYHCSFHFGMNGSVRVAVGVTPARGPVGTMFTVKLASAVAPAGYSYLPQVKLPGSAAWTSLRATSAVSVGYRATRAGTYSFRSSVKHGTAAGTSPSPAKSVSVG